MEIQLFYNDFYLLFSAASLTVIMNFKPKITVIRLSKLNHAKSIFLVAIVHMVTVANICTKILKKAHNIIIS